MATSSRRVEIFLRKSSQGGLRMEVILWADLTYELDLNRWQERRCVIGGIG